MIFAKYIRSKYPKASVCYLGQQDDFGADGLAGLIAGGVTPLDTRLYSVVALLLSNGSSLAPYIATFQSDKCNVVVLDTIPGATDAALGAALTLRYSPQWVISSVGADPTNVALPFAAAPTDPEIGAISFSYLPTTTTKSVWIPWIRKVLTADKTGFPGFSASTTLDGNMAYGAAFGVAFVEALKATGTNLTRATFLKVLTTMSFTQTPSLVPLTYTKGNHQGLNGGYITTVVSATAMKPVTGTIYTTDSSSGPVVIAKKISTGIPSWLK